MHPPLDAEPIESRRSIRRLLASWAALFLALGVLGTTVSSAIAQDRPETIAEARDRQKQLEEEELAAQTELKLVEAEFSDVQAAYDAATELVERQEEAVEAVELELAAAELRARQIEVSIGWAEYDLEQLSEAMQTIAIEAYLGERDDRSSTLLSSADVSDGVTKLAFLELASSNNEDVIDVVRRIQDRQVDLEAEASDLIDSIRELDDAHKAELADLEQRQDRQAALKDAVDARRNEWRNAIDDIEAEDASLEQFIANKQAVQAGRSPSIENLSSDGYTWPTAGAVGSGFGPRFHPILRYNRPHSGLDIGGAQGAPIYAAKAGTVIVAGVNGGYGNTIVVDHGDGLSTLYAHQSVFEVGVGADVATGELVGRVGSTGMSTGPHLHFEVRLFGTPIDPMPFMPSR